MEEIAWPGGINSEWVHTQAWGADVQPRGGRRGKKQAGLAGWQNPLLEEENRTKAGILVLMR